MEHLEIYNIIDKRRSKPKLTGKQIIKRLEELQNDSTDGSQTPTESKQ